MTRFHGLNKYGSPTPSGSKTFKRFQWVLPGKLVRSSQPNYGTIDTEHTLTPEDIQWLRANKIACLISANHCKMKDDAKKLLGNAGIAFFHFKVKDFQPPTKQQLVKASSVIELFGRRGATLVYCGYGQGRTGTVIAAWAMLRHLPKKGLKGQTLSPLCTLDNLRDNFGVEKEGQARAIRAVVGLDPLPAATGAALEGAASSGMGLPLPSSGMGLPLPSSGGFCKPAFSSGGSFRPSFLSSAPPPIPTSPAALGSDSGPSSAGFPDEDNLNMVMSGKWKDIEF